MGTMLGLRQKVRILFILILGLYMIFLMIMFHFFLRSHLFHYALENNLKNTKMIGDNLTKEIGSINSFSRLVMINQAVCTYLTCDASEYRASYGNAVTSIYEIQNAYPDINSILIFRNDGQSLTAGQGIIEVNEGVLSHREWVQEIDQMDGAYILRINGEGAFILKYGAKVVSLIRSINDMDTLQRIGILCINFPIRVLENTYREIIETGKYYAYLNRDGEIICQSGTAVTSTQPRIYDKQLDAYVSGNGFSKWINSYYQVPKTPFILVCKEELDIFKNLTGEVLLFLVLFLLLTAAVLIGIGTFISVNITNPIQKLVKSMTGVKEGWLRRVSMEHRNDEIGMLKDSYNDMLLETSHLIDQLVDKEKSIKKAEINILQEQMKPHFLYNTIEMIACLSLDGTREEIYDALETMGSFYRRFLSNGSTEVTLETELAIIEDYLKIEKLRYGDIFDVEYVIDGNCFDIRLPKLLLQPLVENSLYHGILPKGEKGLIRISVYHEIQSEHESTAKIEVFDSGIGMTDVQMSHIMDENSRGFGFRKTIERFLYFTGSKGHYEIRSEEGEFTRILLCIKL